jgi:hypothetical protein
MSSNLEDKLITYISLMYDYPSILENDIRLWIEENGLPYPQEISHGQIIDIKNTISLRRNISYLETMRSEQYKSKKISKEKRKHVRKPIKSVENPLHNKESEELLTVNKYSKTESLLEQEERKHFPFLEKEDNNRPPFTFASSPEKVDLKNPVFKYDPKNDVKPPTMTREQFKSSPFSFGNINNTPFSFGSTDPNIVKQTIPIKE